MGGRNSGGTGGGTNKWYRLVQVVQEEADSVEDEAKSHLLGIEDWKLQFHFHHHFFDDLQSRWFDFFGGESHWSEIHSESFGCLLSGHLIHWIDSLSFLGLEKEKIELGVLVTMGENVSLAAAGC